MAHDPVIILEQVRQIDERFQALMTYVRSGQAQTSTAYEVELRLFRSLLALGAQLLTLFFMHRAATDPAPVTLEGRPLRPHGWRETTYFSVFGLVRFRRRYYRTPEGKGCYPLDAALSLPRRRYSDLLRDWLEFAVTTEAYDEAVGLLERILGTGVCKHALERLTAEDAAEVETYYAQKPTPPTDQEGAILVVQADGKGVRLLTDQAEDGQPTHKKEAVVTAIYTIQPHQGDPDAISDTLAGKPVREGMVAPKQPRSEPVGKQLRATLDGKDVAFERLVRAVHERDGVHIGHRVALTDGDPALQDRMRTALPDFTLILDFVHVAGYVQAASTALLGQDYPYLRDYVSCRLYELLTGQLDRVLAIFQDRRYLTRRLSAADQKQIATTVGYLRRNAAYMHYDHYLAHGWPIATGVAEGGCGHLVKDRMERAGMKWCQPGAQAVLDLRSVRVNDDWDDYQRFRRQREHLRIYGSTQAQTIAPEEHILALAA